MNYIISIEGQNIPVPEEIGAKDEMVKSALQPVFPDAANAAITRTVKDDVTTITVIKRAGAKGGLQELINAPAGRNPVIGLQRELAEVDPNRMPIDKLIDIDSRIAKAIKAGDEQQAAITYSLKRLIKARPAASSIIPLGF